MLGRCRGYVAPEYVTRGQLTEKVDTYSFGVVLMEIVTGEVNMKRTPSGALLFLVDRVSKKPFALNPKVLELNIGRYFCFESRNKY